MADEQAPSAAYYRQIADEIEGVASRAQLAEVRLELLVLAQRFRRMAQFVATRAANGRGASEPEPSDPNS